MSIALADPSILDMIETPTRRGIVARSLGKVFAGGTVAVDGVDLEIRAGEFVALIGPSGCGKSTLLRMIAGLEAPSAGTLSVDSSRKAFVFQDAQLLPWRTTLANVMLPLELARVPRRERASRAAAALESVGLADAAGRYPAQLSGGMRMRASLARALVTRPQLLLLDEPFAALDEISRQQLDEMLRTLWQAQPASARMTVLFVTHSIGEATFLADRALVFTRRPARVVLDTPLDLPADRVVSLRTETCFAQQSRKLFDALTRGMSA